MGENYSPMYHWLESKKGVTPTEKLVLCHILSFQARSQPFTGSNAYLAQQLNISPDTVNKVLGSLSRKRLIKRVCSRKGARVVKRRIVVTAKELEAQQETKPDAGTQTETNSAACGSHG